MLKTFSIVTILVLSTSVLAQEPQFLTVKERLRLSLWFEGMDVKPKKTQISNKSPQKLPIELEKVLNNL